MERSAKITPQLLFTLAFVIVVIIVLYGEYNSNQTIVFITKPLITILIGILYWTQSSIKNPIFIWSLFFCLVSSIFFIVDESIMLVWGVTIFAIHRLIMILFLIKLLKVKNFFPVALASLPILFIFFYLVHINIDLNNIMLLVFSVNNILLSIFGGIIIANYMMKEDNNNTWLLISALMFIALQLIVYIEKFYLTEFSPRILRPTAIIFFSLSVFTLFKGVLSQERLDSNTSA